MNCFLLLIRFLQTAEMLKPSTPSASHDSVGSSGPDDGSEYYPHISKPAYSKITSVLAPCCYFTNKSFCLNDQIHPAFAQNWLYSCFFQQFNFIAGEQAFSPYTPMLNAAAHFDNQ